jgi:4-alpha-glucanotransferase
MKTKKTRRCGILAHVSSLPGPYGLGDFGPKCHEFLEFLAAAGQSVWQILPLTPINAGAGNSPYSSYSAFAGNILFISPDLLLRDGLLLRTDIPQVPDFPSGRAHFNLAASWRTRVLDIAFDNAFLLIRTDQDFLRFCREEAHWLEDYALFAALKKEHGGSAWFQWPDELRLREEKAMAAARERLSLSVLREKFFQYLFTQHWQEVRKQAAACKVDIMGDVPIYVSLDSADVWANRELFQLDSAGLPIYSAGVPPDYFSQTGQMWGNPVYDWEKIQRTGFAWWIQRLKHENRRVDLIRLDHFRGFCAFWQVPSCEPTAENGVWIPGPGLDLFTALYKAIPGLRLVAEDLGLITPDVIQLMEELELPGMKVLQFSFSENMGENAYIPHNITKRSVVYTGTHDNNTTRGWFERELDDATRRRVSDYAGKTVEGWNVTDTLIRTALISAADLAIIPMQDYLNLGQEGRMNIPGVGGGNWEWRMEEYAMTEDLSARLRHLAAIYGRL